jgi:hypothetical protein
MQMKFYVLATWLLTFIDETLPSSYVLGNTLVTPTGVNFPGIPWLLATKCTFKPVGDDKLILGLNTVPPSYLKYEVTVDFETVKYDTCGLGVSQQVGSAALPVSTSPYVPDYQNADKSGPGGGQFVIGSCQPLVDIKISVGVEYLVLPYNAMQWSDPADSSLKGQPAATTSKQNALREGTGYGILIPQVQHHLTWHQVAWPPWASIRLCLGKVNALPFNGSPPETALFLGGEINKTITNAGTKLWTLGYKFAEKNQNPYDAANPVGWNHFLRNDGDTPGSWMRLQRKLPNVNVTTTVKFTDIGTWLVLNTPDPGFDISIVNHIIDNLNIITSDVLPGSRAFPDSVAEFYGLYMQDQANKNLLKIIRFEKVPYGFDSKGQALVRVNIVGINGGIGPGNSIRMLGQVLPTDVSIPVASTGNFPQLLNFNVIIDNEVLTVTLTDVNNASATSFAVVARGVNNTQVATHVGGAAVSLQPGVVSLAPINKGQTIVFLQQTPGVPILGQFNVLMGGNQLMLLNGLGNGRYSVMRPPLALQANVIPFNTVGSLIPGYVYEFADFTPLFQSGLALS